MNAFLLQILLRTSILSSLWLAVAYLARRRSAATQHAWTVFGLVGLLILPLLHAALSEVQVALLPALPSTPNAKDIVIPGVVGLSGAAQSWTNGSSQPSPLMLLWLIWLLGSIVILSRCVFGIVKVRTWAKEGEQIEAKGTQVPVIVSERVTVPLTAWIGRSVILAPLAWHTWPQERREAAIRHEMAHIKRRDWLSQLTGRVVCAALWPNPIVWHLAKKSRFLAERAADDVVLSSGMTAARYAQILLETAKEAHATLPQLSVCMAQGPNVARRIELILHPRTERASISKKGLLAGALLVMGTSLPIAVMAITHHKSAVPVGQGTVAKQRTQFFIECVVLEHGVRLADTGLKIFAETKSPKGHPAPGIVQGLVYSFPVDSSKELISKWRKAGKVQSSPAIRTISGQVATITSESESKNSQTLRFTPKLDSKGELVMSFSYDLKQDGKTTFQEAVTYSSKLPGTVILSKNTGPNQPKEVFAVVTVRVVDPNQP